MQALVALLLANTMLFFTANQRHRERWILLFELFFHLILTLGAIAYVRYALPEDEQQGIDDQNDPEEEVQVELL